MGPRHLYEACCSWCTSKQACSQSHMMAFICLPQELKYVYSCL